ncbi:hypothetical protein MRX96_040745 [Rhipicephalus microplus]
MPAHRGLHQMWSSTPWQPLPAIPALSTAEGGHSADTPTCPRWQEERKVATLLATAPTPLSRRAVKNAVCDEYREVRSYAAAVRVNLPESLTKESWLAAPHSSAAPILSATR